MRKMNIMLLAFLLVFILTSFYCADPSCTSYAVDIKINFVPTEIKELWIRNDGEKLLGAVLTSENGYQYKYMDSRMGPQGDYRNPDGELKAKLDRIMQGTVLNIDVHMKDGTRSKYTILYNNLNCVDTIGEGDKYHTIKITLDWKDVKPVENH